MGLLCLNTRDNVPSFTVRVLGLDEAMVLDRVAPDVFDNEVDARWTAEFFADPRHHLAVAIDGDTVVGMASAVHYVHPDKPPELWVNEVGVAPTHQGRGIGRQLMQALFARGRELGCREAWVLTEHDNAAARRLYASIGGAHESTVIVTFRLTPDP
jgi:ribosomal protein S18 acetylase RimI-like enzyme